MIAFMQVSFHTWGPTKSPKRPQPVLSALRPLAEQGFLEAISLEALRAHLVTASELSIMVYGCSSAWQHAARLQDIFHVVLDKQLQQEYHQLADCFWEVCSRTATHD